jgi:hypothetical protein
MTYDEVVEMLERTRLRVEDTGGEGEILR